MKSMFTMGFFSNDVFRSAPGPYLGQADVDLSAYLASVNQAMNQYQQVVAWVNAHPNYAQLLGGQASYFQQLYQQASGGDYNAATQVQQILQSTASDPAQTTATIDSNQKSSTDAFISEVNQMQGIIASAETPASPGVLPSLPGAISQLLPGQKPATPGTVPAPAPAPASSGTTTALYVGGGILAVGLIALLAKGA